MQSHIYSIYCHQKVFELWIAVYVWYSAFTKRVFKLV